MSTPARERYWIAPERLRRTCDLSPFSFQATDDLPPFHGLIGQERALKALQFGLEMSATGYNIYVAGLTGTGKTSHTRVLVERKAAKEPPAHDWCYVYNFDRSDSPMALRLDSGKGPVFAREMAELVRDLRTAVRRIFSSQEYKQQRTQLVVMAKHQIDNLVTAIEQVAASQGFSITQTEGGLALKASQADGAAQEAADRKELEARAMALQEQLTATMQQVWQVQRKAEEQLHVLDRQVGQYAVIPIFAAMMQKYEFNAKVQSWLGRVQDHVLENLETLLAEPGGGEEKSPAPPLLGLPGLHPGRAPDPTARYQVHVLVTHGDQQSAPVVFETNPTYANLFGRLDQSAQVTDPAESIAFLSPGALHRASGGYLILQMEDLLKYPAVWDTLKRSLLTREVAIQAVPDQPRLMGGPLLRPEPVPIAVKVILIGGSDVYAFLWSRDETFRKLFKVKVEFDPILEWNAETLRAYLSFLGTRCRQEGLPHLDRGGVGLLIEYAARLAEDQRKISAQFNQVLEVLYEASALAQADQAEHVTETHVAQAIRDKRARSALVEERFQEMIGRGHLLIGVDGSAVGQVNGLSVYTLGEFSFGVPSRVTARIWMGRRGIVHIEKETMMSGQIHNKGVLTLSGFFGERFAQDKPLSVSASLSFEQLYGGVEGDSASSTELFALLSAIAEAPIDQGIGVTGSVNQAGEIQPVGGVNQKVEGFFRTCRTKGLTGRQGVILPIQNVENLMLDREVVEAVRAGQFHVWAVSTVEEGIEILTGIPAGVRQPDGQYPPDTIFGRVDRRLRSMAEGLRAFDGPSA